MHRSSVITHPHINTCTHIYRRSGLLTCSSVASLLPSECSVISLECMTRDNPPKKKLQAQPTWMTKFQRYSTKLNHPRQINQRSYKLTPCSPECGASGTSWTGRPPRVAGSRDDPGRFARAPSTPAGGRPVPWIVGLRQRRLLHLRQTESLPPPHPCRNKQALPGSLRHRLRHCPSKNRCHICVRERGGRGDGMDG